MMEPVADLIVLDKSIKMLTTRIHIHIVLCEIKDFNQKTHICTSFSIVWLALNLAISDKLIRHLNVYQNTNNYKPTCTFECLLRLIIS